MSKHGNRVMLSAWVDPALRDHAREAAKDAGIPFSQFIERAVQQHVARRSLERLGVTTAEWEKPGMNTVTVGDLIGLKREDEP